MCLLIHFVLKNIYVPYGNANIMFLSSIRFELFSLNMVTPYHSKCDIYFCVSFVRYTQVFFHPEVLDFLPIYVPHIVSISGKPHLFSWERLDSKKFDLFVYTS